MSLAHGENVDVIANVRLTGGERMDPFEDEPVDVHLADGVIADIAPAGVLPRRGRVLDGDGTWLIPGLWDHHVHVVQWAMSAQREPLGGVGSAAEAAAIMGRAHVLPDGRRVGSGFRDALWPDAPTLAMLVTLGAAVGALVPLMATIRQERSPAHLLPRVVGLSTATIPVTGPIGVLAAGLMIDGLGLRTTLLAMTTAGLLIAVVVVTNPGVRLFGTPGSSAGLRGSSGSATHPDRAWSAAAGQHAS